MNGAIWLASYPKSGNTWARLALWSLLAQGRSVDLVDIASFGNMLTGRRLFDKWLEAESSNLTHEELEALRPALHDVYFSELPEPALTKIHDRWSRTASGRPMFDRNHTHASIYLLRDPRDVAISWARFSSRPLDWAIHFLANSQARVSNSRRKSERNVPQWLGHWSEHVTSWIDESGLAPLVVRYEDMIADMPAALTRMAAHLGWPAPPQAVAGAVAATRFERLADQETRFGFMEIPDSAQRFFVTGKAGGWRDVLTPGQAERIEQDHRLVMERFGYL